TMKLSERLAYIYKIADLIDEEVENIAYLESLDTGLPIKQTRNMVARASENFRFYRSEEHTSELQSRFDLVCRLLLEKKKVLFVIIGANADGAGRHGRVVGDVKVVLTLEVIDAAVLTSVDLVEVDDGGDVGVEGAVGV